MGRSSTDAAAFQNPDHLAAGDRGTVPTAGGRLRSTDIRSGPARSLRLAGSRIEKHRNNQERMASSSLDRNALKFIRISIRSVSPRREYFRGSLRSAKPQAKGRSVMVPEARNRSVRTRCLVVGEASISISRGACPVAAKSSDRRWLGVCFEVPRLRLRHMKERFVASQET
jgi:hypothetical protein